MADFCKKCSIEMFGKDCEDFKGSEMFQLAICEGCGVIQVDPDGNCISDDCLCEGHNKCTSK